MFKNILSLVFRGFLSNRTFSIINVFGLAIGLGAFLLISIFLLDELSYDQFHDDSDRVYRVITNGTPPNGEEVNFATTSRPMGTSLRADYPEIESLVRFYPASPVIKHENTYFYSDKFFYAEPSFFDVLSFDLISGDPENALIEPNQIVITESMGNKYFGGTDALGQTLILNDSLEYTVSGVLRDIPSNSHFHTDFLISYATLEARSKEGNSWLSLLAYTYVKLNEGVSKDVFQDKISGLVNEKYGEVMERIGFKADMALQPITEIHLNSDRSNEIQQNGNVTYVYFFSVLAIFILFIACVNYINLSTARSLERAKEIGIRKVLGSERSTLIGQFLLESFLYTVISMIIAVLLVSILLPVFNEFSGKSILLSGFFTITNILRLGLLVVSVALLAGIYPAFSLSGFYPIEVLKGAFASSSKGSFLRKSLVTFQFAVSVILIAGTIIVFQQLNYMYNEELGFEKEQVLVIDARGIPSRQISQNYETLTDNLVSNSSILTASASSTIPGREGFAIITVPEDLPDGDSRRMQVMMSDHEYLKTMDIEVIAGRDFSKEFSTDATEGMLINEAAVKDIGYASADDALGKKIRINRKTGEVVGVFKNYFHNSLKTEVEPMVIHILPIVFDYISVKVQPQNLEQTLAFMDNAWSAQFPGYAFEYFFLDDDFAQQYQTEENVMKLSGAFSFIAIFIASLGLFGLAMSVTQQRTKEIGIRKVLGANITDIFRQLTTGFLKLTLVGFIIAIPITWYGMNIWLGDFVNRIEISPTVFLITGIIIVASSILTISWQAYKAALNNPVESLRSE